jgi:hypothetical protein
MPPRPEEAHISGKQGTLEVHNHIYVQHSVNAHSHIGVSCKICIELNGEEYRGEK